MKLHFNLSSKRIQEAVKDGILLKKEMCINVDLQSLSEADRQSLSENILYSANKDAFDLYLLGSDYSDFRSKSVEVNSETLPGIIAEINKLQHARNVQIKKQEYIKSLQNQVDSILENVNDDLFKIERFDNTHLYFRLKEGKFSREFVPFRNGSIEKLLEFVKTDELINKLNDVKTEFAQLKISEEKKAAAEAASRAALEAGRNELLAWSKEKGSELLKLRIKHGQNWQSIAVTEWAIAHSNGFAEWDSYDDDDDDNWPVANASLNQLKELEISVSENPEHDIDIMRSKWVDEDGETTHRTFIKCIVKTPVGTMPLYREILDADDEQ